MVTKKTWEEFRATGLLQFINTFLHLFRWAIVVELDVEGQFVNCFTARVKFRGFDERSTTECYQKVSNYLKENITEIAEEAND